MPFFDYQCPECERIEEIMLSRAELDTKEILCCSCNHPMKRLLSAPPFTMKGAPPKDWKPLTRNSPKSEVRNIHEIRRVEPTK